MTSRFSPEKQLANVKRHIASRTRATMGSRVTAYTATRALPSSTPSERHRTLSEWLASPTSDGSSRLPCTVPALLQNTSYTSANVWKDARQQVLEVDVLFDVSQSWTPAVEYLDNVRQQCAELTCVIQWHDGTTKELTWWYAETPELTLQEICAQVECAWAADTGAATVTNATNAATTAATATGTTASTWPFMIHDSHTHTVVNSATAMATELPYAHSTYVTSDSDKKRWWSSTRFDATVHDYSRVHRLMVTPLNLKTFDEQTLEVMDLLGNREAYRQDESRRQRQAQLRRDTTLRQEQDAAFAETLASDRKRRARESAVARAGGGGGKEVIDVEAEAVAEEAVAEEVAEEAVAEAVADEAVAEEAVAEAVPEAAAAHPPPLTREQLRTARLQYYAELRGHQTC